MSDWRNGPIPCLNPPKCPRCKGFGFDPGDQGDENGACSVCKGHGLDPEYMAEVETLASLMRRDP
jgi:hypothetical protein